MTKTQYISAAILAQVAAGKSVKEAIDAVLGAGRFDALASDLYDTLRKGA